MHALLQDIRHALRALAKRPTYALVTIAVLVLAIGANTTVFSVLYGFLLRPLPYPDGERLVMVYDSYPKMGLENAGTAIPDYLERREQAPSLESLAILSAGPRTLGSEGQPERIVLARASASLFDVLRVAPLLGRAFTDDEATTGRDRVVVLSHRLWSLRFAGDRAAIGGDILLDDEFYRVIGVMPESFGFPDRQVDAWMPFAFTPEQTSDAARGRQFSISVGRLRPGATVAGLNAELDAIVHRNVEQGRAPREAIDVAGFTGRAQPLRDINVGDLRQMLLILQATVLAVLLIACANVANLQLARSEARRKEFAVRAALGAGRSRLARLVLVESLMLALAGAAGGLALAAGGIELVRVLGLDRASQGFEFTLNTTVLGCTLVATVMAALIAGLPPVVALLRDDLSRAVHEAGRLGGGGRSAHALRNTLVVVQIGLSVALLVGAGLLTRSFYKLQGEGPGFNAGSVWTGRISLPATRYATAESRAQFHQQALDALQALPGTADAGFTSVLPFSNLNEQGSIIFDAPPEPDGSPEPHAQHRSISEGYLAALGIPVRAGRNFSANEPDLVVIVDDNLANKYFPDGNSLGQRLRRNFDPPDRWYTIVGVVPAVKQASLAEATAKETVYWHYLQRPVLTGAFALRTTLPPDQLTGAAIAAIAAIDPALALYDSQPMDLRVTRSLGPQRAPMVLTLVFAAVAFTLAVIGIYGVLTWAVTQRSGEIGVRMALGARPADIVRMILRQGCRLIAIGLTVGLAGALALGRVMAAQIQNVSAVDPVVFAIALAGITVMALLASWLPARRASRIDPMRALRSE